MICCWLRACHVRSLHKGAALLRRFCMCRLHLTFSCTADRLRSSCGTIRRTGRGFCCRGRCMVLRRCHVARRTSGAGRHGGFARGVRLLSDASRRGLRECARHLFGGGLYGIRLCSNRLSRNRFLIECRIRAVLLRRRAMMIAVCVRGRIDIGSAASTARARAGRCIRLGISAAAARLIAVPADGMRCIGHH